MNFDLDMKLIEILEEEVYKGENYGRITPIEYVDSVVQFAKEENIDLGLLTDGSYNFIETEDYKVIQAVDYNGDLNIGYGSIHLILLDKETLETRDYYVKVSDNYEKWLYCQLTKECIIGNYALFLYYYITSIK